MTLPFRRRHHDDEAGHDRARALTSAQMLDPLGADDEAWLMRHLEACAECRQDRSAFLADRELLRSLRGSTFEPPRDLWARTSAAIEHERGRRPRVAGRSAGAPAGPSGPRGFFGRMPLAPAAGALVLLVVFGSVVLNGNRITPPSSTPGSSPDTAVVPSLVVQPTPLAIDAEGLGWIQSGANGDWELMFEDVDEVCPQARPGCSELGSPGSGRKIDLGKQRPTNITANPDADQLVVEQVGDATAPGKVFVVPVPTSTPPGTPKPTDPGATIDPEFSLPISSDDPEATPNSTPSGGIEIATGVAMVGDAAYSSDGSWLAFSARPSDGTTGPDLYLWHVGDAAAQIVTTDHATFFSSWLGTRIVASRVVATTPETPAASADPTVTAAPETSPAASPEGSPVEAPAATSKASPTEAHPVSFLLDPETLDETPLAGSDVWLPVVDPKAHFTAYWAGTVVPSPDGLGWVVGAGAVVLDGWNKGDGSDPSPSDDANASTDPTATVDPAATADAAQAPTIGPAGHPVALADGQVAAFKVGFDPDGSRIALWVSESADEAQGRLHLIVINRSTGAIDPDTTPLQGVPALRRFSLEEGRLAWVNPSGTDGQESSVQVLGWKGHDFGEIQTIPAKDLFIVR